MSFLASTKYLLNRVPRPRWMTATQWLALPAKFRSKSFFSATVTSAKVLDGFQQLLADYLEGSIDDTHGGYKVANQLDFQFQAREMLLREGVITKEQAGEGMGGSDDDSLGNLASGQRLDLIFQTHTNIAYEFGTWQSRVTDPVFLSMFPCARFKRRAGATEKRARHVAAEGEVRRWDDFAFWTFQNGEDIGGFGTPFGPFGYNSYMYQEPVPRAECIALGLITPDYKPSTINPAPWGGKVVAPVVIKDDFKGVDEKTKQEALRLIQKRLGIPMT